LSDVAAKLRAIVERVRRNVPHRRDPERFHVEKSCVCQDLERIAEALDPKPINHTRGLPIVARVRPGRVSITTETIAGRRVIVQRARMPFSIALLTPFLVFFWL
jgi:hypothetical protein